MSESFIKETALPVSRKALWQWHTRPGAFERLAPPWQSVDIVDPGSGVADGSRTLISLGKWGLKVRWLAEHRNVTPPSSFEDVQIKGPFRRWVHRHRFLDTRRGSLLRDEIDYQLPLGRAGELLAEASVQRDLERTFAYRHTTTAHDILFHSHFADHPPLRVAVSGASGLIGSALCAFLTTGGHHVVRLVRRRAANASEARWDPASGLIDLDRAERLDALVHLAGENIASSRWTKGQRQRIRASRVEGTSALVGSLERLEHPPSTVVCASAVGVYGDRGDETLTEHSQPGAGFLADVGRDWEQAAMGGPLPARRVMARLGIVLSPRGGALARMLTPFRLGLGGRIGSGTQFMSWIALDDAIAALAYSIFDERLVGPVNVTAPAPVTNREFSAILGRVLGRPSVLPMPATAARLALGDMADELLLASTRAMPRRLQQHGFEFRHPHLESALRHMLGRP